MKPTKLVAALSLPTLALSASAALDAQTSGDFMPQATIKEVMASVVMPAADALWNGITYDANEAGETIIKGPETEEGWQTLRSGAVLLAESANLLVIPGRAVDQPGAEGLEGELSPQEIDELVRKSWSAWVGHAHAMHAVATQVLEAIDAKNAEALSDVSGAMDAVCTACHSQFWYPEQ